MRPHTCVYDNEKSHCGITALISGIMAYNEKSHMDDTIHFFICDGNYSEMDGHTLHLSVAMSKPYSFLAFQI